MHQRRWGIDGGQTVQAWNREDDKFGFEYRVAAIFCLITLSMSFFIKSRCRKAERWRWLLRSDQQKYIVACQVRSVRRRHGPRGVVARIAERTSCQLGRGGGWGFWTWMIPIYPKYMGSWRRGDHVTLRRHYTGYKTDQHPDCWGLIYILLKAH